MKKILFSLGRYLLLTYDCVLSLFTRNFEKEVLLQQIYEIGVKSTPVCLMTSAAVGMVLALQTGMASISVLNEPAYIGTVVTFSLIKELGPMLTAVVLVGRIGAAITAEIGTMRVTEQIDAMYTLGTDPIKYLLVPRIIGFTIVLPILTMLSDIVGIVAGGIMSYLRFDIPSTTYISDSLDYLSINDFFHGLIKAIIFGIVVSTIACYKGFYTEGGAEGVGKATTSCVVTSIVFLLIGDYFLSSLLISLGIG